MILKVRSVLIGLRFEQLVWVLDGFRLVLCFCKGATQGVVCVSKLVVDLKKRDGFNKHRGRCCRLMLCRCLLLWLLGERTTSREVEKNTKTGLGL